MEDLSPRQRELLDFIGKAIEESGVVPSFREIGAALGIGSTNGVSDHIKALVRKGYIEHVNGRGTPRSLRLTAKAGGAGEGIEEAPGARGAPRPASASSGYSAGEAEVVSVPVLGRIAAGLPLLAEENHEGNLQVDPSMLPRDARAGQVFALVVNGDSMIEDGIHHGDYLLVREANGVRDGEIGVVMVDGDATVKRVYREGPRLRLQPANATMEPIWVDARSGEVSVIGRAVGVFRRIR
jgi:repressor LexA